MKKFLKKYGMDLLFVILITVILSIPYLFSSFLPFEHDTHFHVSRIEQLSRSISEGNFFPALYPYENDGFGYASPLFYCDYLLIPAALLHLAGASLSLTYRLTVFTAGLASACTMLYASRKISGKRSISWIAAAAYLFSNYRLTDIYVRGALGEIFAFTFLPLILLGMYEICWKHSRKWKVLTIGLTGLVFSHNLTFLMGAVLCIILFLCTLKRIHKQEFLTLCKAVLTAFLLSACFTLPMIEQMRSQKLILNYYASASDLSDSAMKPWHYFVNQIIFGYSGNNRDPADTMTVNVGWVLTFAPVLWFFAEKKKDQAFITLLAWIGYACMFLCGVWIPWSSLQAFGILQFVWRLNTIAMVCLSIPAAYGIFSLFQKKQVLILAVLVLMCGECIWHVQPVFSRTAGMTDTMTWQDILDGKLYDPYFSADYVRVELAGGDYLPLNHIDYRTVSRSLMHTDYTPLDTEFIRNKGSLTFTVSDDSSEDILLPLTWYKGWKVSKIQADETVTDIPVQPNDNGIVQIHLQGNGTYTCRYESTPFRKFCFLISIGTLLVLIGNYICTYRKQMS
jgi:hypothetical protein